MGAAPRRSVPSERVWSDVGYSHASGRAHGEVVAEIRPASAFVGTNALLHPDLLIEIEATAIVQDG